MSVSLNYVSEQASHTLVLVWFDLIRSSKFGQASYYLDTLVLFFNQSIEEVLFGEQQSISRYIVKYRFPLYITRDSPPATTCSMT